MNTQDFHPIVHILASGGSLCGILIGPPQLWPNGHKWAATKRALVTCAHCSSVARHREKVVPLSTQTKLDIPVERILDGAKKHDLQQVIVIGAKQDGTLYVALSTGDVGANNLMLDCAKAQIVNPGVIARPLEPNDGG